MINFGSPILSSIFGGAIMALASTLHLYLNGKITGISGAIFRTITLSNFSYNFSFITGMLFMSSLIKIIFDPMLPQKEINSPVFMETPNKFIGDLSIMGFILAGFLVGFGAKMGNGCTSGHGVCGLPRLSKRSIVAISFFMIFGVLMATIRYYIPFLKPSSYINNVWESSFINIGILVLINTVCGIIKNTSNGEPFSWKILGKGLLKAFVFYACSTMLGIAFRMLPEVNKMIQDVAGVQLFAQDTLNTLSSVAVFAVVAAAVISQGKSALEGVTELLQVKVSGEKI
jgi:uncharacterized membrane protein YedE/YeeE